MNLDYIFVYGTLRSDANSKMHRLLAKHAEFIDVASYRGKLYKIDYYPGAIPSNDPSDSVRGEVYRLDQADYVLPLLDRYEECGPEFAEPNEYIRQKQTVRLNSGSIVSAWVYIYNRSTQNLERINEFSELK